MKTAAVEPRAPHAQDRVVPQIQSTERLLSLDAYRGLIMLTLVANGFGLRTLLGDPAWDWLAAQTEHVAWQGCVYWDLIQPSFMFMVGVAMPLAFSRREAAGESWGSMFKHVCLRALNLLLIGMFLDSVTSGRISIGLMRVLQQIAIGYFFAFFVLGKGLRVQGVATGSILIGYTLLWMFNPWNGPEGPWARGNHNIGSAFDLWLAQHYFTFPQGIDRAGSFYSGFYVALNAIPSTATIIFGVMMGELILRNLPKRTTMLLMLAAGLGGILMGLALSPAVPLIKRIWTPSFAIFAAGWTSLFLLFFYWIIEHLGFRKWCFPLVVIGTNSIAAYVIANLFGSWLDRAVRVFDGALIESMGKWGSPFHQCLILAAIWGVLYFFYRRRIFFKA